MIYFCKRSITKGLLLQCGQVFHQAAFAAGGVVLMDDTFFGSLIQSADGDLGCLKGAFLLTCLDRQTGPFYKCTRPPAENTIAQASLLILLIALNLGLDIRQSRPPTRLFLRYHGLLFYLRAGDLSSVFGDPKWLECPLALDHHAGGLQ